MRRAVDRLVVPFVVPLLALALVAVALAAVPAGAQALGDEPIGYVHPVDAPVIDPFRAPTSPYGPGNRGLEYDTPPGVSVGAAAPGVVLFAGPVAGALHVTLRHADGRLTSYSFLAEVAVRQGELVDRGHTLGTTGGPLHVGVREAGEYVDPALLFGVEVTRVQLVPENPFGSELWLQAGHEVAELAMLTLAERGGGPGLGDLGRAVWGAGGAVLAAGGELVGAVRDVLPHLLEVAWRFAPYAVRAIAGPFVATLVFDLVLPVLQGRVPPLLRVWDEAGPLGTLIRVADRTIAWVQHRLDCTPGHVDPPPPPGRRVAILVGGLGSTSSGGPIGDVPVDELGYEAGDVLGFSYEGGRTDGAFGAGSDRVSGDLAGVPVSDYDRAASTTDLRRRADLLADLLVEVEAATPGVEIDLFAHSQGGLVAHLAVRELASRDGGAEVLDSLGLVATMATPHHGSDLAAMAVALGETGEGAFALRIGEEVSGWSIDPATSTNLTELARDSELVADTLASEPPPGPTYLALAARGDPLVLAARTRARGATHVTLPVDGLSAHTALPGHPTTARELALARAGMSPTCESFGDFLADTLVTEIAHNLTVALADLVAVLAIDSPFRAELGGIAGDHLIEILP